MMIQAIWLSWWSEANAAQPNQRVAMYMGTYALFGVLGVISACLAAWYVDATTGK
jgi:ATP-binding cassette, subfamily C (CFTR/MRP), member 1